MKTLMNVIGLGLMLFGLVTLGYQGFTYTKQEPVAKFGVINVTEETEKTIHFPPLLSGLSLVSGLILVIVFSRKRNGK